ncbi:MAG: flagellar basal body-associated FliL family protein [Candidatus Muiribacteriaceae bacterium]
MPEEVKTGNPLVKYLTVAILGIVAIILVTGISYFMARLVYVNEVDKIPDHKGYEIPQKVEYNLQEFLVPTADKEGIIKVKITLGLSEPEVAEVITTRRSLVRDNVIKILVSKTGQEAIADYTSGKLEEEIRISLNEALKHELGGGYFEGKFKEIVRVYFVEFLVQ